MSTACSRCGVGNPTNACFCQGCGTPLAATQVNSRTVVLPTSRGAPFSGDAQTIAQRARQACGNCSAPVGALSSAARRSNQREHLFLVEDISDSMGDQYDPGVTKLEAAVRASANLILNKAQIDPHDEIGLIVFNSHARVLMDLKPISTHKPDMIKILQSLQPDDGTDINEGLLAAKDCFDWRRQDVVRRIVLLTDGQGGDPRGTAQELKQRDVIIDVVGVGERSSAVNEPLLKQVASLVEGQLRYRFIRDSQTLVAHYTQLAQKTATRR